MPHANLEEGRAAKTTQRCPHLEDGRRRRRKDSEGVCGFGSSVEWRNPQGQMVPWRPLSPRPLARLAGLPARCEPARPTSSVALTPPAAQRNDRRDDGARGANRSSEVRRFPRFLGPKGSQGSPFRVPREPKQAPRAPTRLQGIVQHK